MFNPVSCNKPSRHSMILLQKDEVQCSGCMLLSL